MIPTNALVSQIQAYLQTPEQPLVQVVDAIQEVQALFTVGEQVRAQVTGQLPSGRFAVLVKDQLLDLNLPRNTEEGADLNMRVLANSPRLTFLVDRPVSQQGEAPPQQAPGNPSSNVSLSDTAHFLGQLLSEASAKEQEAAAVAHASPLMDGGPIDPAKLARALQSAIQDSGVFYESHLAQWAQGERSLDTLMKEPQGKLSAAASEAGAAKQDANASKLTAGTQPADQPTARQEAGGAESDKAMLLADQPNAAAGSPARSLDEMPTNLRQLVQQQLQTLDQRQVVWQGQAWQGQPLKWEVEEDRGGRSPDEGDVKPVWRTRLYLDLPKLGTVEALVSLTERKRVDVNFNVTDPQTADRIRRHAGRLQHQLDAAGLELTSQQVGLVQEP